MNRMVQLGSEDEKFMFYLLVLLSCIFLATKWSLSLRLVAEKTQEN